MEALAFKTQAIVFSVLLNGMLYLAAARVAASVDSRRDRLSATDRFLIMMALAAVGVLAIILPLALSGVLTRWAVFGATALLAGLSLTLTRQIQQRPFMGSLVSAVAGALRSDRLFVVAFVPGAAAIVLLLSWAAVRPSFGFDPLNYHLPLVAEIFRSGSLVPVHFPPYFEAFPYFTMNGDLFSLWAMLSSGDASLLALANLPLYVVLGVSIYSFAREYLPSRAATALTSALLTVPAFFVLLTDAYVEIPLWAFLFASLRLVVLSGRLRHHSGLFVVASFLCGAMIGTKLTGIPMAVVVVAVWLFCTPKMGRAGRSGVGDAAVRRGWADGAGRLMVFAVGAALFGSAFYIRNFQAVGSPVYPFPLNIGGFELFAGDAEHAARVAGTTIRRFLAPLVFSGELFKAMVGTKTPPNSSWGLGITGPLMMVAAFSSFLLIFRAAIARAKNVAMSAEVRGPEAWTGLIFLCASALSVAVYINLPWCAPYLYGNVRFVYPAVPFAALALISLPGVARLSSGVFVAVCVGIQLVSFFMASIPLTVAGLVTVAVVAGLTIGLAFFAARPDTVRIIRFAPAILAVLVVTATISLREVPVQAYKNPGFESGPGLWASDRADCLKALDKTLPSGRFLLTMARAAPHAWFIFPLLGDRLQREPVYADISREGRAGNLKSADYIPGYPGADRDFWLSNVQNSGAKVLVIMNDQEDVEVGRSPVEFEWVRSMPDQFRQVHKGRFCSVYSVSSRGDR
jgi:hypothetical protein